jgi:hypothetical protein
MILPGQPLHLQALRLPHIVSIMIHDNLTQSIEDLSARMIAIRDSL